MNSRQLRRAILDRVPYTKFLLIEEGNKPKPMSKAFWDNPHSAPPLRLNGSPAIVALVELLCSHLHETTGARSKRTEVLNLLISEGLEALSAKPQFAGLRPNSSIPDEDEIMTELGFSK